MKNGSFRCLFVMAALCAALGASCVAQVADPAGEAQTEQASKVDDGANLGSTCTAWNNCYNLCRLRFRCDVNPAQCDRLADCLDSCDAQFPQCF